MQARHLSLVLPPVGGILLWSLLAALGLPAFATIAGGAVFLAIYVYLARRLTASEQRSKHTEDVAKAVESVGRSRRLAIFDPSNELLAQWYFEFRLEEEVLRCLRYQEEAAILVIHPPGSTRVSELGTAEAAGNTLRGVRQTDLVGNLDEGFALCLVHCDRQNGELVANRLLYKLGDGWQFGIATIPEDAKTGKQALEVAQARLKGAEYSAA